jgi:hypothetical protein
LAIYWSNLEYHTKALMPWKLVSQKQHLEEEDLLLDYISPNYLVLLWTSIRLRHIPVVTAAMGSVVIILITVASTGLFVSEQRTVEGSATMSVLSRFDTAAMDANTTTDSFPVLIATSILSGNLSIGYPLNTNEFYATEPFVSRSHVQGVCYLSDNPDVTDMLTLGSILWRTGLVNVFSADLACEPVNISNFSALISNDEETTHISAEASVGHCSTGVVEIAQPDSSRNPVTVGRMSVQHCPDDDYPKLFVLFAKINTSFYASADDNAWVANISVTNSTGIVCTPNYILEEARVTVNSSGDVIDINLLQSKPQDTVSSSWDLLLGLSSSFEAAGPVILNGPSSDQRGHQYDSFFGTLISTWIRQPEEYLDPSILERDTRHLFAVVSSQIANRYLRKPSDDATQGTYEITQMRIITRGTSLRIVEAGLALIITSAILMVACSPCPTSGDGSNLACLAVILAKIGKVREHMYESDGADHNRRDFYDSSHGRSLFIKPQPGLSKKRRVDIRKGHQKDNWWTPLMFSNLFKTVVFVVPLAVVLSLEIIYRTYAKKNSLGDVPSTGYWHILWTWIPASIMTIIKLLSQTITSSIALLEPFRLLRDKSVVARRIWLNDNLSRPSLQLLCRGLSNSRWAISAAGFATLLGPFLTIIVSGLFVVQPTHKPENMNLQLVDHLSGLTQQASLCAANLLDQGYGVYPQGTYENYIFSLPQLTSKIRQSTENRSSSASILHVDLPSVLPNVICHGLEPDDFRYIIKTNYSISYDDFQMRLLQSRSLYLEFAHPELIDYYASNYGTAGPNDISSFGTWLDSPSGRFSRFNNFTEDKATSPESFPDPAILQQAANLRNTSSPRVKPDIVFFYGSYNQTWAAIAGVSCVFNILSGSANVTIDLTSSIVLTAQPATGGLSNRLDIGGCMPWDDDKDVGSILPSLSLFTAALNGSAEDSHDTPEGTEQLAHQTSRVLNNYFTQFYNTALRDQNVNDTANVVSGIYLDNSGHCLTQNVVSTRILQALILTMWLCTSIALILFDAKKLLPKNPCSIAAQASLLADADFLALIPDGAEHLTRKELMEITPFKDHLFSMGWWDNKDGTRRFGIDVGKADHGPEKGGDAIEVGEFADDGHREVNKTDARVSVDLVDSRSDFGLIR